MQHQVAVVMAAYNADKTIREAVDSLLRSTVPCRIYIIDDCSRIPVEVVLGPSNSDRIEIIRLAHNAGPAAARNAGLARILHNGHPYVAIMDADDRAHSERLTKQMAYLEAHPDIAVVGCWERVIDDRGEFVSNVALPCDPKEIRDLLFVKMCVSHPTWMVRADVFTKLGVYSPSYPAAEDYEFIRRVASKYDVANLPEYLVEYRLSSTGMSARRRTRQLWDRMCVQLAYFSPLKWQAWFGVARTLALLIVPAKRRLPDTISAQRAKALQSA
ncbi:MAG: glycosyltransferase family 2 protein [Xanthobacteraceae bacterium]